MTIFISGPSELSWTEWTSDTELANWQWISTAALGKTVRAFTAADRLVWLYRSPAVLIMESATSANQVALLDAWLRDQRTIFRLIGGTGSAVRFVNSDRITPPQLQALASFSENREHPVWLNDKPSDHVLTTVNKLFCTLFPGHWDVFERLESDTRNLYPETRTTEVLFSDFEAELLISLVRSGAEVYRAPTDPLEDLVTTKAALLALQQRTTELDEALTASEGTVLSLSNELMAAEAKAQTAERGLQDLKASQVTTESAYVQTSAALATATLELEATRSSSSNAKSITLELHRTQEEVERLVDLVESLENALLYSDSVSKRAVEHLAAITKFTNSPR